MMARLWAHKKVSSQTHMGKHEAYLYMLERIFLFAYHHAGCANGLSKKIREKKKG